MMIAEVGMVHLNIYRSDVYSKVSKISVCLITWSLSCFTTFSRCVCQLLHEPSPLLISFF